MSDFAGFTDETRQFLLDLRENNDREWYNANKKTYENVVKAPAIAWVQAMGTRLQDIDEKLTVDTRTNGGGSLMRMARDTRFSKDKSPYKTNIAMMWWHGTGKKTEHPAFGMQITPDDGGLVVGMFGFPKPMLEAYRQAVVDDELGEELVETATTVESAGYEILGKHYKTTPRGFDKEHPRAEWLKFNGLYTHAVDFSWDTLKSGNLVEICFEHFEKMSPIHHWLVKTQDKFGEVQATLYQRGRGQICF